MCGFGNISSLVFKLIAHIIHTNNYYPINMHEQLQILISKFKNHEYYSQTVQNQFRSTRKLQDNCQINQEIISLNKRIQYLQEMIEALITDGNRMNHYYEEIFNQMTHQFEVLKEQFEVKQHSHQEESHQDKKNIQDLCRKIQVLQHQITQKQEILKEASYKYDELLENATEVHIASSTQVKLIETSLIQQSKVLENELNKSRKQIQDKEKYLNDLQERLWRVVNENNLLKDQRQYYMRQNESMFQQIECLKIKLQPLHFNNPIHIQDRQVDQHYELQKSFNSFKKQEKYSDKLSNKSSQNMEFDGIIQLNGRQIHFDQEKSLLNISQHYGRSFMRRSFEKTRFLQNGMDETKNNILRPPPQLTQRYLAKVLQKQQQTHHNTVTQAKIQLEESQSQTEDPYRSFFILLAQSQKINSPYFNRISTLNVAHLYEYFRAKRIPFNKWQENIRLQLEKKINKPPATTAVKTARTIKTVKTESAQTKPKKQPTKK